MIIALVIVNAFFVASEMALARIRRTRIDQLADEGSKDASVAQKFLSDPDRFIFACQLGITLDTLALGAVSEHIFAGDLINLIMRSGLSPDVINSLLPGARVVCYAFSFTLTAFMQTIFGEMLPKTLTFHRAEPVLLMILWPMQAWCWFTAPILSMLDGITDVILKLFNVKEPPRQFAHSEEELKMLVSASQDQGVLEEEEEEMLHSVFDFSETQAYEVMTPKSDMVCIQADASITEFLDLALTHGLSRLPAFEQDVDSIFGAVHIRDGLRAVTRQKDSVANVRDLVRPVLIVPENKPVGDLLTEFKKTKTHMAIVVDEYGGTRGLVTIEDLIEELVGEIADEHEVEQVQIVEEPDGTCLLDGRLPLYEANEKLHLKIEDEEFNTLGGHVFGRLGREPKVGDQVENSTYILRVEAADRHRIIQLRLIPQPAEHPEVHEGGGGAGAGRDKDTNNHVSGFLESSK